MRVRALESEEGCEDPLESDEQRVESARSARTTLRRRLSIVCARSGRLAEARARGRAKAADLRKVDLLLEIVVAAKLFCEPLRAMSDFSILSSKHAEEEPALGSAAALQRAVAECRSSLARTTERDQARRPTQLSYSLKTLKARDAVHSKGRGQRESDKRGDY